MQLAAANQTRNVNLLHTRVIAQREFDQTDSANNAAAAELLAAEADLKTARVDLDHAYVKAPISGRVSRAELTVGNFVQNGAAAPLLTSIVSENGIYADFEVDEQTYLSTIRDAAVGNAQEGTIPGRTRRSRATPGSPSRLHPELRQPARPPFGHDPRPRPVRQRGRGRWCPACSSRSAWPAAASANCC